MARAPGVPGRGKVRVVLWSLARGVSDAAESKSRRYPEAGR